MAVTKHTATSPYTASKDAYLTERTAHWDQVAANDQWGFASNFYQKRLAAVYQNLIPPGARVLELGCGKGDLLAALKPSRGVGVDLSARMITAAASRYPGLCFIQADAHGLASHLEGEMFDYVILSDLINDLWDIQLVLDQIQQVCHPSTPYCLLAY